MFTDKKIEIFVVNQDIQIQIDHLNKKWFDGHGKLLIEDIEEFLQEQGFIEDKVGIWRDTNDGDLYSLNEVDIDQLKHSGVCRMYKIN